MIDAIAAIFLVDVKDRFRVGVRCEFVPTFNQGWT